jgi:hypothetical protein
MPNTAYPLDYAHKRALDTIEFVKTENVGWHLLEIAVNDLYFAGLSLETPIPTAVLEANAGKVNERSFLSASDDGKTNTVLDAPSVPALQKDAQNASESELPHTDDPEWRVAPTCSLSASYPLVCFTRPCNSCPKEDAVRMFFESKVIDWNTRTYTDKYPRCSFGSDHCKNTLCSNCPTFIRDYGTKL